MADKSDYIDIIERLEKATGADRRLDADMWPIVDPDGYRQTLAHRQVMASLDLTPERQEREAFETTRLFAPKFTASIDAALTLVPEGWAWFVERIEGFTNGDARIWLPSQRTRGLRQENFDVRNVANPAIALCIAALKARSLSYSPTTK